MNKQELLNAISTLSGTIDSLVRAREDDAVEEVVDKLLELVARIK